MATLALCMQWPGTVFAWGPKGHAIIGNAAVSQLTPSTRVRLMEILGVTSADTLAQAVDEACFWPDTVRDSPQWSWSAPLHFVNIPRAGDRYDRQRDCPDGMCVTEGILKYAAELGRPGLDRERRRHAFAWLCHLVGDLHQPLHAGFRDDRGGNRVAIVYRDESSNLHRFWDSLLVKDRLDSASDIAAAIEQTAGSLPGTGWNPAAVAEWTAESHALAATRAYPPGPVISEEFADSSWTIIQQQWRQAAGRLALVLNAVLSEGKETP